MRHPCQGRGGAFFGENARHLIARLQLFSCPAGQCPYLSMQ